MEHDEPRYSPENPRRARRIAGKKRRAPVGKVTMGRRKRDTIGARTGLNGTHGVDQRRVATRALECEAQYLGLIE